jgi:hypothetical protein
MTEVEWRGPDSPLVSDRGTTIPRNPYRKLRQWARSNGRGFYSTSILRRHARLGVAAVEGARPGPQDLGNPPVVSAREGNSRPLGMFTPGWL